jgi:hypothetical protein
MKGVSANERDRRRFGRGFGAVHAARARAVVDDDGLYGLHVVVFKRPTV